MANKLVDKPKRYCGDVVLFGNKVGTIMGIGKSITLALCDGSTTACNESELGDTIASAIEVARMMEKEICRQAQ